MYKSFLAVFPALLAVASAPAEGTIHGRVHHHDGSKVEACFDRGFTPAVGDEFLIVRHSLSGQPKSVPALRSETVGTVRITALAGDSCASAALLQGDARALDWIASADKS